MANQITDNRTSINVADNATGYVDLSGGAAGALDTEIFYEGSGSIGQYITSTLDGLLYDFGTATDVSNNVFYILVNCGIVGLLDTKALGGFRIRFTGATATDWFEVYVAGNDSWPASFSGGWTLFVVDIEDARATAVTNGWTNGTTPATTAIQRYGWAGVTGGTMPRMVDNTWMDVSFRLPDGSPAIIVEGRNGGTTDWDWDDVVAAMAALSSPIARYSDGGAITLSGPVQYGINDTSTHGFTSINKGILWDSQEYAPSDLYSLSALGNVGGTTNVTLGIKTGTGTAASGSQGGSVSAADTGARWSMDFNDPNLDLIGLYGCSFQHIGTMNLDDAAVDVISSLYIDGTNAIINSSNQLKDKVINSNTASNASFYTTDNLSLIVNCEGSSSGTGHFVELTSIGGGSMTWFNNTTGYVAGAAGSPITPGTSGNEDIFVNVGAGTLTINVATGANTPSVRSAGATINVVSSFTLTLTDIPTGVNVTIVNSSTRAELQHSTSTGTDIAYSHDGTGTIDILLNSLAYDPNLSDIYDLPLTGSDSSIKFQMLDDLNYSA